MSAIGWILIIIGALINFLAKPVLQKASGEQGLDEKTLYTVKTVGMLLVIAGASMIFVAGGKVDVRAIR
ncbi:MAG: hypothetical protein II997_02125 [Clostridia bacterium]|nr:hypothetical protein [Clostridia bacterium]